MSAFYTEPDEALKRRRFTEYKTRIIEPLFPPDKTIHIADLGCGYGLFLDACQKLGYKYGEGVDLSQVCVQYAKRELQLEHVSHGDLFNFLASKDDSSLDVVTAFNIIEHVERNRVPSLLDLIYRKVRPGGMFVMEVPNADSPLGIHTYFSDVTHEFAYSRKLAVHLVTAAGFGNIDVRYEPNIRHPLIKIAQRVLAKIIGLPSDALFSGNLILVGYKK